MDLQLQNDGYTPRSRTLSPLPRAVRREAVVFGHALELLLADAGALGPQALGVLGALGLSPREPLQAAYPGSLWAGAIRVLSSALYPHLPSHRAEFALGRRFQECLLQSRIGAAMNAHAQLVGPERTLQRLPNILRAMNNFLDASARELPQGNGWELVLRPLPEFSAHAESLGEPPHFARGVITTAFQAAGVSTIHVDVVRHDAVLGASTFHVTF